MPKFKVALMYTEVIYRRKEIEVEADSFLDAADMLNRASTRFEQSGFDEGYHVYVGDRDIGTARAWPYGSFTRDEEDDCWLCDDPDNPLRGTPWRLDWVHQITPEQRAAERAELERRRHDPEAQAADRAALERLFGGVRSGSDTGEP